MTPIPRPWWLTIGIRAVLFALAAHGLTTGMVRGDDSELKSSKRVELKIQVLDERSSDPIADAEVVIAAMKPSSAERPAKAKTNKEGIAKIAFAFPIEDAGGLAKIKPSPDYAYHWIDVAAEGHKRLIVPLSEHIHEKHSIFAFGAPVTIKVERGEATDPEIGDFAGEYTSTPAGKERMLSLSANGAFYFENNDKGKKSYFGTASVKNGVLTLTPSKKQWKETFKKQFGPYHVVKWGERRYLIEDERLASFSQWVNLGFEPRQRRQGPFLLKASGWDLAVKGVPELPGEHGGRVLKEPIEGSVAEIDESGRAKVNLGWSDGVYNGMQLVVIDASNRARVYEVLSVGKSDCTLELDEKPCVVGSRVSSRMPIKGSEPLPPLPR